LNELQTDEAQYALELSLDLYSQIQSLPEVKPVVIDAAAWLALIPNKARPPFDNVTMRQALNHALDKEAIARAAYGNERFWGLDGSIFFPTQEKLYTTQGTDNYLAYNPDRAKQLMEEAGYNGETIRYMVTNEYPDHYNGAQAMTEQLKAVGFNIDLQVVEWATLLSRREDKDAQEMFTTTFSPSFDPTVVIWFSPSFAGWYESDRMQSLLDEWIEASSSSEQEQLLAEMNETFYEEYPLIKICNSRGLQGHSSDLRGYESWIDMRLWNTGFSQNGG
jgi:peptide/nickel transport system substrate-binding protein